MGSLSESEGTMRRNCARMGLGFTLVEVLVVIAIICTLAALAFPVYPIARERGRRTVSASNLGQLAIACNLYAADYDDWVPPFINLEPILETHDPDVTSVGLPTNSKFPELLVTSLMPYARSDQIWFCPDDPYAHVQSAVGGINHEFSSYMYLPVPGSLGPLLSPWPPQIPCSSLAPTATIFYEVSWFRGKQETSYWNQPVSQRIGIDGHLELWSIISHKRL